MKKHFTALFALILAIALTIGWTSENTIASNDLTSQKQTTQEQIRQEQVNVQLIQDYYAAYAKGNLETLKSFFAPNIIWRIPGHHPLAGEKRGADEVIAFFTQLAKGNFKADPVFFQAQGNYVVDIHRGWSNVEDGGAQVDQLFTLMFKIENGKIVEAQNFLTDQHQADAFFWRVFSLKPLPDRLAQ